MLSFMERERMTSFSEDVQREHNKLDNLKKRIGDCDNIDDFHDVLLECGDELLKSNIESVQTFLRGLYDSDNRKRLRESLKAGDESIFEYFPVHLGVRDKVKELTSKMIKKFESLDNKNI